MSDLYSNIRRLRIEKGLSQDELARRMGYTSRSSIAKIESGENDIPQSKIVAFAKALDTTPAHLMGWNDDESKQANWTMEGLSESPLSSNSIPVELKRGTFADKVNKYMLKNNVSQKDICDLLGVDGATVSKWLDGSELPNVKTIDTLADFLRVKRNDLLDKKSTKYSNQEKKTISIESDLSESELDHIKKYRLLSENNKQAVNITIDTLLRAQDAEIAKEFHPDTREKAI